MNQDTYIVNTICMTFNQMPYIEDAFNGFTMQETSFPFVCTIMDDASTDGEQDVIKKYLQDHFDLDDNSLTCNKETPDYVYVFTRHKTNHNCFFAVYFLKYNHFGVQELKQKKIQYASELLDKSKYIALCEGDDYWTDSKKLQKQVDFLDSHPDYVICSHDFLEYSENNKRFYYRSRYEDYDFPEKLENGSSYYNFSLDTFFLQWTTQPLACLFRNGEYLHAIPLHRFNNYLDDVFYYYILKEGKGALLQDVMGVYRLNDDGTWSSMTYVEKWKKAFYNAYNIYSVEGDERALLRMKNSETVILYLYLRSLDFKNVMKELREYYTLVPFKHFLSFILSFFKMLLSKLKRRIKHSPSP